MPKTARYPCQKVALPRCPGPEDACWDAAPPLVFVEVESGKRPFLHTELRILRDDAAQAFYLKFDAEDDEVHSTYRMHDEPLYTQDVFELFIADSGTLAAYREIEVSPYDLTFTGDIAYKTDTERVLNMDRDIPGMLTRTRHDWQGNRTVSVWMLPYAAFSKAPEAGGAWRFNAFRVDHSRRGVELAAWQATGARNFHVPDRFGWLDFPA